MRHGTYRNGCRCEECREAHRVDELNRRRRRGIKPTELVPLGVRIDMHTQKADAGCWLWQGSVDGCGYGMVRSEGSRRVVRAHRAMWELEVGPIPRGMTLDHLCHTKNCVYPGHLEVVTRAENSRRIRQLEKERKAAA